MQFIFSPVAGINAYYALFRRTKTQFRDERVHRLLVPILFLDLVTQLPISLAYFAPPKAKPNWIFSYFPNYTYLSTLQKLCYATFQTHHAWTLIYLFIFSQMFSNWFCVFHPNHNKPGKSDLSYNGSTKCSSTLNSLFS